MGKLTDIAGDAARYFDINPKNITRRYDIICGGIDILRKLTSSTTRVATK